MDRSMVGALVAVLAVSAFAFLLRRFSGGDNAAPIPAAPPDTALDEPPDEADAAGGEDEDPIAVTSDGWQFIPMGDQVQLLPPEDHAAPEAPAPRDGSHPRGRMGERLGVGEFTGARVGRGAAGFGPWRLEALGPEGEYLPFPFETETAARAALEMLERRGIVRISRDEDGHPLPASPEDFEEARRRYEQTADELAISPEDAAEDEER